MRGARARGRRWAATVGFVVAGVTVLGGCAGAEAEPGTVVPTFAPTTALPGADSSGVPLDPCVALIPAVDVANVLGLDSSKTTVRTVRGMPSPSVGRTDRLDCVYLADRGRTLFTLRTATYVSAEAALEQWTRNAALEDGDRRDFAVGVATGLLFSRRGELLLSLVDGPRTVALQVPDRTVPEQRDRENLIVDFAQRALKVDPDAPTTAAAPAAPPSATDAAQPPPAQAGGS